MAKAQIYFVEVMVFLIAAVLVLTLFLYAMSLISTYRTDSLNKMERSAYEAANMLVLSRGDPSFWNSSINISNMTSLGLAQHRNELDNSKLAALAAMNSTDYKTLLGLLPYNARVSVFSGGTLLYQTGSVNSSGDVVIVNRICVVNATPCNLRLEVSG